jgi:glutamine phosphoribosylpyrophosphate amidotransferase
MVAAVRRAGAGKTEFCMACFVGDYPTGDVTEQMLTDIEQDRLAASKG